MTTKHKTTTAMKKIVLLFLFILGLSYAQPPINNPTPLNSCDQNNSGITFFFLLDKVYEVLGSLDPNLYTVTFHETIENAQNDFNPIEQTTQYLNITPWTQTLHIRVEELANSSNFSITSLLLNVNPKPQANQVPHLTQLDNPFDGQALFNLTLQSSIILGSQTNCSIQFYPTFEDAVNDTNAITNPTVYQNISNPQTIGVRVINDVTDCFSVSSFNLILTNPDIVFIPDVNFKTRLLLANSLNGVAKDNSGNSIVIDINGDNEIQNTEVLPVAEIRVSSASITDLTGITAFTNLEKLDCNNNALSNLDLTGLNNLQILICDHNTIQNLDLSNNISLIEAQLHNNNMNSLNLSGLINLKYLHTEFNNFTTLDASNLPSLEIFGTGNSNITNLLVSGDTNLTDLNCTTNSITSLDVNGLINLQRLYCSVNPLLNLTTSTLTNLSTLGCASTLINSLDLSNNNNVSNLEIFNTPITTIDVSNLSTLSYFICGSSNLLSIFMKNGSSTDAFYIINSPNLEFICCDELEVISTQNQVNANGSPNTVINTYCSFTPGGNFNTITGTIRYDANNNSCDASDSTQSFIRMNINDGTNQGATFTNATGTYNFYTLTGNFTVNPSLENPSFFTITPASATIPFTNTNNNVATQNFCISANGVHPDLEIVVAPITPARPGFNATYRVAYKNKGNQTLSGTATLNYNDAVLDFVSATAVPTSQSTGVLNWNYTNLLPFESRSYFVTLNVNTPNETPPVNIDDVLTFSSTITPVVSDAFPLDNSFTLNQTVVGSFDPNEIRCLQGSFIPPSEIGNYLHYMVNFENTGNAAAENVVVKVDIDATKYDIATLQMLNTSHPSYTRINGNKVEFIFENINLSATSGNPPVGGHGNVLFKIRSKNTLVSGNTVAKQANIYFDYNAPIDTNMAQTTFGTLNNTVVHLDESISIFPNPTSSNVNINSKFNIKSVELYDIQGRILETVIENSNESFLDISTRQNGIYFLKITTDEGSKVEKIIKE